MTVSGHHVPVWYDEATGPVDGQVVVWNATTGRFEPGDAGMSGFVTETVGASHELDLADGNKRLLQLADDTTLAIAGDTDATTTLLVVIETGAGDFAVTWWDGINWGTGSAPTVTTAADKRDVFSLLRLGAGDWLGFVVGQALDVPVDPDAPTVPGAPTIGTATRGNAQASVTFTAPVDDGGSAITGYTVTSSPGSFTASGASSPIVVPDLTNGTPYTFRVHATNAIGNSAESSASNSVTPATVPGAPTVVVGTPGDTTASIAFSAPASNGGSAITGYTATLSPGEATFTGSSSPIAATELTNGTAYTASVHATNAVGSGAESTASSPFTPAASGGGFVDPSSISGLLAWFDPDTNAGVDGDEVTTWVDSSVNGFDATQVTEADRPLLRTGAFGSHKAVDFDGSNDFMLSDLPADSKPFTIVAAVKVDDLASYMAIVGASVSGGCEPRINATSGVIALMRQGASQIGVSSSGVAAATAAIVVVRYSAGGVYTFWVNGGANVGTGTNDQTFTASTTVIAQAGTSAGEGLKGLLGYLVKYDSALSLADLNALGDWLGTRLGIAWATAT